MKKLKVVIPTLLIVTGLLIATPLAYTLIKEHMAEAAITEEYEAFLADNEVFFDNSFFNGVDISGLTPSEACEKLKKEFESQTLIIKSEDGSETDTLKFDKLSVDYKNLNDEVSKAFDGQTISKAEYINGADKKDYSYDLLSDIDFDKTDLSGLKCTDEATRIPSRDAYVAVDKVTGVLTFEEETYGNELKEGALEQKISKALHEGENEITILSADYKLPEILAGDEALTSTKKYYETLLSKTLTVNACDVLLELTKEDTLPLLDFEPGDEANEEAIREYVLSLKSQYDTYMSNRLFNTTTGETVWVMGGSYGWAIDIDGSVEAIKNALLSNKADDVASCTYAVRGQHPANAEIGNTYVEIDLRDQKIWMYVNGVQIVNDDITTGMYGDPNCLTATGTYALLYKKTNCVLKGPTWNDFVFYWMPYDVVNAVGMHDATWRSDEEFGGDNRFGNGSHGCVNMRLGSVAVVYENIQMDTPIIVWE